MYTSALVGSFPSDGVTRKIPEGRKTQIKPIPESNGAMFNMNSIRNDVNGTGTPCEGPSSGRSLVAQQHEPGRNPTTARKTWSKNDNKQAMMSYFKSEPLKRGYRKRMLEIWKEIGTFDLKEQQLADQVRSIRKNSLMSEVEMEG